MKRVRPALLLFSIMLFGSCSAAKVYVGVVQAKNDYSQGDYQEANRRLIRLESSAFEPWIAYNLGTIYYALGEPGAASEIWSSTGAAGSAELAFRLEFNRGVLDYEQGAYRAAYEHFREAATLNPASVEAKVNLEFALEKLESDEPETAPTDVGDPGEEVDRMLQYLERIERDVWRSSEVVPEAGVQDW